MSTQGRRGKTSLQTAGLVTSSPCKQSSARGALEPSEATGQTCSWSGRKEDRRAWQGSRGCYYPALFHWAWLRVNLFRQSQLSLPILHRGKDAIADSWEVKKEPVHLVPFEWHGPCCHKKVWALKAWGSKSYLCLGIGEFYTSPALCFGT